MSKKRTTETQRNDKLVVERSADEDPAFATARAILDPPFRHGVTAAQIHKTQFGSIDGAPGLGDYADALIAKGAAAAKGDLAFISEMLAAQAITLDSVFTEMTRRMAINMGEYLGATETYGRLAFKAQAQSRATLDLLAKIHQPREQTVKHVHVNQGSQAVVADHFHAGAKENEKTNKQCHATGAAGERAALPSPDPARDGMPIPLYQRETQMSYARRDEPRSA